MKLLRSLLLGVVISAPLMDVRADGQAVVEQVHEALIAAMHIEDHAEREILLKPVIEEFFDISSIARISLGRTWRSLNEDQQAAFAALLLELITVTYADRFDSYSGQRFETVVVKQTRSGQVVSTRLIRSDGTWVSLDYFLRTNRIFNVVADGVSDLSLRRADYNSVLKSEGYDRLLEHIGDKIKLGRGDG